MLRNAIDTAEKAPDAFRSISEVATSLAVPPHVLRFWETRFNQIRPMKRAGGRRLYRPEDVDLIKGIKSLLYEHRYTIRGVQAILTETGAQTVIAIGRGAKVEPPAPQPGVPAAAISTPVRNGQVLDVEELRLALTDLAAARRILETIDV